MSGYLAPSPPGVEPDWSNEGWASKILDLCIVLLVLNTLFVAARIYTRLVILKYFGVDDCFCLLAYGMTTAETGLTFHALQYGFGRHAYDVPTYKAPGLYRSYFILGLLPGPAYFFIKMTFFLTYARIFSPAKYMRWLIWGGVAVTTTFYLGDFLYDVFQCQPIAKAWNPTISGTCAKEAVPGGPTGIFNVISDLYILILPMPIVWSLNMNWRCKAKILLVLSLGIFTCAMSMTRLAATIMSSSNPDKTYAVGPIYFWANLEWSVGLMVACMIVCPALLDHMLSKPLASFWARISSTYQSMLSVHTDPGTTHSGSRELETDISKTTTVYQETESV